MGLGARARTWLKLGELGLGRGAKAGARARALGLGAKARTLGLGAKAEARALKLGLEQGQVLRNLTDSLYFILTS